MSNESPMKKCGDCGQTGHTSTSCRNGKVSSFNLFGVRIDPTVDQSEEDDLQIVNGPIHESKSTEFDHSSIDNEHITDEHGLKKGMPWTEEEHRAFLSGLEKLGKGQWRAISKHHVPTRTPTQVASHAQKYFIRMNSPEEKRKRRSSLFDLPLNECSMAPTTSLRPPVTHMARTYGVEGYNRFPNEMDYHNNRNPAMNYMFHENAYPLNRWTGNFSSLGPQPLRITNGERWSTQQPENLIASLVSQPLRITNGETRSTQEPEDLNPISAPIPEVEDEKTKVE